MNNKIFFPQVNGILHGSDYNPDQWLDRPDILEKDIELMKKAKMTSMSLGIFSWSAYEPTEGEFHMDWLKDIMDKLYENGIYTILATPSGARPAWLDEKYPECMRVGADDHRAHHGVRHNHCMSSPKFREKTGIIINKIIDTVGKHPGLAMWHLSNEFGGECFCPLCKKKFQDYLANKFDNDINKLNKAWWTGFWSHTYNDFSQIEPPYLNGEFSVMGLNLEWKRFTTWNTTDYMKSEIDIIRKRTPNIPITTNFMQLFPGLDYRVMAKELDVISWDSYPVFHNNYETMADTMAHNSFDHAVMRSLKKNQPFMLMECAPGLVNWHEYNKLKRPGVHKLFSAQAVACGSDTVQYFQWRKSRGSFEQYHGAVVDHLGTDDTRVFKEVAEVGAMLDSLSNVKGTIVKPKAALIFDWDNMWAIDNMRGLSDKTKNYAKTCIQIYHEFLKLGIDMNVVASDDNLDDYNVVIAPMLYMLRPGASDNLKAFVKRGGQLMATYLTGYVDDNTLCYLGGFPGDGLSELFGVISEEIDTYYDSDENSATFTDGHKAIIHDYAEILRVSDTDILAKYDKDFYAGTPAITCKNFGKGKAYYVGARIDMDSMSGLFKTMLKETNTTYLALPAGIEYHKREDESGKAIEFYLNVTENEITFDMTDNEQITLKPYGVKII